MLKFGADWSREQTGPLFAGDEIVVRYHRARLAGQEQLDQGGSHNWVLSGFCRLGDGPSQSFQVGGRSSDDVAEQILTLPGAGTLELWFEWSNRYGDHHFDSDYGRNFRFTVQEAKGPSTPRTPSAVQVPQGEEPSVRSDRQSSAARSNDRSRVGKS